MTEDLAPKAAAFARELGETLAATLPGAPSVDVQAVAGKNTYIVQPSNPDGSVARVPLFVNGVKLAELSIVLYLDTDRTGTFLKNVRTDCAAYSVLDRQPLFRMDYRADMHPAPIAHWQFHAERGSLTHLLSMAHAHRPKSVDSPHLLSRLHFPVGGERFRPCIEDLIQFVIEECGVDSVKGWGKVVKDGREHWRRIQLRTVVRDLQWEAAEILAREGWTVMPPTGKELTESTTTLRRW
ncbi:hypothetical protein [Microbacterium sp.]|uniref:hypothetical protein n=1 Tax=Microbacterium sp. TaxID=51671 RepID=UPI002810F183|nr:hypothetical protein [Microbacterium sp.]